MPAVDDDDDDDAEEGDAVVAADAAIAAVPGGEDPRAALLHVGEGERHEDSVVDWWLRLQ